MPSLKNLRKDIINVSMSRVTGFSKIDTTCNTNVCLFCRVLKLISRALTEIFILQTGNASCSPRLADSQELNLFAGTHS